MDRYPIIRRESFIWLVFVGVSHKQNANSSYKAILSFILVSSKLSSACNIKACPKQFSVFMHTTMYSQQRPGVLTWLKLLLLLIRG